MPDHRILLGDLVIFGDFDRPSADMIACVMKIENGVVHGEYLSERSRRLDSRPAGPPESVTLVERFGVRAEVLPDWIVVNRSDPRRPRTATAGRDHGNQRTGSLISLEGRLELITGRAKMPDVVTYPIIMSTPMVRQIDAGRKTRTFRLPTSIWSNVKMHHDDGDRVLLWVREAFREDGGRFWFRAEPPADPSLLRGGRWAPSIHMRRESSRFSLEITDIRLQRLNETTEEDVQAEGCRFDHHGFFFDDRPELRAPSALSAFALFWNHLHPHPGVKWHDNPEGYAIWFKIHRANVDQVLQELAA